MNHTKTRTTRVATHRVSRSAVLLAIVGGAFMAGRFLPDPPGAAAAQQDDLERKMAEDTGFELEMRLAPDDQAMLAVASPGPHHRFLDPLIGEWDVTYRVWSEPGATPMEYKGTVTREWILGGRFVREELRSPTSFGEYHGIGFLGYDNFDQRYEFVWMQNETTSLLHETATYDASTKTLHSRGTQRDPATGRLIPSRGEVVIASPDRQTGVGYAIAADGSEYRSAEAVFVRRR